MAFTDSCWPGYETQPTRPCSSFRYGCYSMYTVPKIIHKNLAVRAWADAASVCIKSKDGHLPLHPVQCKFSCCDILRCCFLTVAILPVVIFLDLVLLRLLSYCYHKNNILNIVTTEMTSKHPFQKDASTVTIDSFPCLPRFNKKPWFIQSTVFIYFLISTIVCAVHTIVCKCLIFEQG